MKVRTLAAIALAAALQPAFAADDGYGTAIAGSFARAIPAAQASGYWTAYDQGALRARQLQLGDAQYWDNVQASFGRLRSHDPYAGATVVIVDLNEKDPVETRVHAALRLDAKGPTLAARR